MFSLKYLKKKSYLVYGLGLSGRSVVNFFDKNNFKKYFVWDDNNQDLYKKKRAKNLNNSLKKVDYIILSPGVSLNLPKNKKKLINFEKKIITDIDLVFMTKNFSKSIVVTGTNGKSTVCKMLFHILKKNKIKSHLGGNIGKPILDLKIKKRDFLIIEASSYQLSHSKFIKPDYAILLNITNDHLDWHGNMKNYIKSKLKIFELQSKNQYSIINNRFRKNFKKRGFLGKMVIPKMKNHLIKSKKIENLHLSSKFNQENMTYVFELAKLLKIKEKSLIHSLNSFKGLPHRFEIFLKKNNFTFINDSKATTFESTKSALQNTENIYWILGGLPKKNDKIKLKSLKKNIIKSYIIGNNINFFKKQLHNKLNYQITKNLKNSIIQIIKDIKKSKNNKSTILLSPSSASFDQYQNFEKRGNEFKKLSRNYARKYL